MIWNRLIDKKPLATQSGEWDGLKSDEVLVQDKNGDYHIAVMYKGFLDGSDFCDFYDTRGYEIENVVYWTEIDSPY